MNEAEKVLYLVVDTSAFIQNASLQNIGVNIITEQDVVNEVINKRQLRRLVVLPYDLKIQNADPEDVKFVTEFAKKTGDYTSLSATDIKVIALTYKLQREQVGIDNLRSEPIITKAKTSNCSKVKDLRTPFAGFYIPEKKENIVKESREKEFKICLDECFNSIKSDNNLDENKTEDLSTKFSKLTCESTKFVVENKNNAEHNVDDIVVPVREDECNEYDDDNNDDDDDDDDDDSSGWITPGNIGSIKKELHSDFFEQRPITVACLTMDFAMQNVLKQIGLNVVALDGRIIKQMRTFIFRCYACYKTTSIMTKVFCPSCGNKTLKKVSVTLNENGKQIYINFRKPISTKGKRFSLPMPKGGKHANNPILCEDQPVPDQRLSKLARTKNDPLQDDYIAGYSPFIMRDVHSKSAMLGTRSSGPIKYWMRKNPNEVRRQRK